MSDFAKAVGMETHAMLDSLLLKALEYIHYKGKEAANNARDSWNHANEKISKNDEPLTSH